MIRIENLKKRFGNWYALKGIDLVIEQEAICGIIGMSGAGKSTLLRCLIGLETPSEGHIFIEDEDLTALSPAQWQQRRKRMGVVFQNFHLFSSRTALENVIYPLEISSMGRTARQLRAQELLEWVGLKGKEHYYPGQLSGGEAQRVAIARALAYQPRLLFFDEPTSSLDPRSNEAILKLLIDLHAEYRPTIVIITHQMEVVKQAATQVAVLESGEIVEAGPAAELFCRPRHPTTIRFLQPMLHELPRDLLSASENIEYLRLSFRGNNIRKPLICQLIREYAVEVNILFGNIDLLLQENVGHLVIALSGSLDARTQARHFLEANQVYWEKIG